jgi:hypothetical protein
VGSIPTLVDDYGDMPPSIEEEMRYRYEDRQDIMSRGII